MNRVLYTNVSKILDGVDFAKIYPGFHRFPFALFDGGTVWLENGEIPKDNRFLGNTAIDLDGVLTAIWDVETSPVSDIEVFACDLVHEMFHAYQRERKDEYYADDLTMLSYPDDFENHCARLAENRLLAEAYRGNEAAFSAFCASRRYRKRSAFVPFFDQELRVEHIEGGAEYAGSKALQSLAPEKFSARMDAYLRRIVAADSETFFDIRKMGYWTGTLVRFARERFSDTETRAVKPDLREIDRETVAAGLEKRKAEIDAAFDEFYATARETVKGRENFQIVGYDPMNMILRGDELLCTRFLMLQDGGESLFFDGPLVAKLNDSRGVTAVIRGEQF